MEDDQLLLKAIIKKLQTEKIDVVAAASVNEAVSKLTQGKKPDAIWLDYYLGDKSGIDFMHILKKNSNWSDIPVVVVSNSASEVKKREMFELGVNYYLLKSENKIEQIIETIRKAVSNDIAN